MVVVGLIVEWRIAGVRGIGISAAIVVFRFIIIVTPLLRLGKRISGLVAWQRGRSGVALLARRGASSHEKRCKLVVK
jgi:hypothetical protein